MATDRVRTAAHGINRLERRFAGCFGHQESQAHSQVYLRGLMLAEGRKNVEAIALEFAERRDDHPVGQNEVLNLQGFLTESPWDPADVQREIQATFAEELVPSAANGSIGVVGVLDGSSFVKRGSESVGVKRQWCGRLGKTENCQVAEFLIGVTRDGCVALDQQLYLPHEWIAAKSRRNKTRVPKPLTYRSQNQIALDLLRRVASNGHVHFDWVVTADALEQVAFKHSQEFGLDRPAHLADFVKHQSAFVGGLEFPDFPFGRACEGTFFMTKQFAF